MTTCGPGTTSTRSSATGTSRSSTAGRSLYAYAMATEHTRLGLLVGANTFRNPGLQAKNATSLDHISNGRAILGIGAAWFEKEHEAHGIRFGASPGQRLDWLDESVRPPAPPARRRVRDVTAGRPLRDRSTAPQSRSPSSPTCRS